MLHLPAGMEVSPGQGVHRYERHRPEQTLLYQFVEQYYPAFVDQLAAQDATLPEYVLREFDDYLRCGRLDNRGQITVSAKTQENRGQITVSLVFHRRHIGTAYFSTRRWTLARKPRFNLPGVPQHVIQRGKPVATAAAPSRSSPASKTRPSSRRYSGHLNTKASAADRTRPESRAPPQAVLFS